MENRYINHFLNKNHQIGSGVGNIGKLYKSNRVYQQGFGFVPIIDQQGQGLGSILQNLYQLVYPIIKSGFNALGTEAKTAGKNILRDITTKPITDLIREHGTEAISNLKNKTKEEMKNMRGRGVKKGRTQVRQHPVDVLKKKAIKKAIKNKTKSSERQSTPKLAAKRVANKANKKKNNTYRVVDIFD